MIPIMVKHEMPSRDSTWDDSKSRPLALGCQRCPDFAACGGLHTSDGVFDCGMRCRCSNRAACDRVCRLNPEKYVARRREVKGFHLTNVPRVPVLDCPKLPPVVPVIEHASRRRGILNEGYVAVPLSRLYDKRNGAPRFTSRAELCSFLRIRSDAFIIASGVGKDHLIEPFWRLNSPEFLSGFATMGLSFLTVPNFSVFSDVPRPDNLHAIKRIGLAWSAMVSAGLPTALHLNARTDRDYNNWCVFVRERPEVAAVAFEFGTGAGNEDRIDWHIGHLCDLADETGRPLTLFLRGGIRRLPKLRTHFDQVVVLDTTPFAKTRQRQRAVVSKAERLVWEKALTEFGRGKPLDDLLAHNIELSRRFIINPAPPRDHSRAVRGVLRRKLAHNANDQARQGSFAGEFESPAVERAVTA
jgi:hypothetical protein